MIFSGLPIESMRDIGRAIETALADLIDDSVTAGAKDIRPVEGTAIWKRRFAEAVSHVIFGEGSEE